MVVLCHDMRQPGRGNPIPTQTLMHPMPFQVSIYDLGQSQSLHRFQQQRKSSIRSVVMLISGVVIP